MRPKHELGQLLRNSWSLITTSRRLSSHQKRILKALAQCRTAALGGHLDACSDCGHVRISYNSCRNRHCPKCQGRQREAWIAAREEELLPVPYFHVVFTLPSELNGFALKQPKGIYTLLFKAAWQTMQVFASDPKHLGAETAMIAILHTWGQNLSLHPHLHCIVPAGGLTRRGKWRRARNKGKFLFPVKAMSKIFRAKFVALLRLYAKQSELQLAPGLFKSLFAKKWVIYAKQPFGGPRQVLEYLGRYTHKVAISNHRITQMDAQRVSFSYKDYRKGGQKKLMSLELWEFIRRFAMHILPRGFVRIRHYGFLASRHKARKLKLARHALANPSELRTSPKPFKRPKPNTYDPQICPCCGKKSMKTLQVFLPKRAPPVCENVRA